MVFHWSLSAIKFPQVSRTLLSILVDLNDAVVWMVSACRLMSKSSSPFTQPLEILPGASNTTLITVTFLFHSFYFSSLARSKLLSLFVFFDFHSVVHRDGNVHLSSGSHNYLLIRVFHISVNWWSFTRVWVTESLPKSLGLFSVSWPFSIM